MTRPEPTRINDKHANELIDLLGELIKGEVVIQAQIMFEPINTNAFSGCIFQGEFRSEKVSCRQIGRIWKQIKLFTEILVGKTSQIKPQQMNWDTKKRNTLEVIINGLYKILFLNRRQMLFEITH